MKKTPLISVLLPVYNDIEYLEESILSILEQSLGDFELLILDDGSDIPIFEVIKKFKDKRIKYYRFHHQGLTITLNRGLALSQSDYIARQDADDISFPDRFKYLIEILKSDSQIALVGSNCQFIDENNNVIRTSSYPSEHRNLVKYLEGLKNPFPHSSVIFRRDAILKLGGYDSRFPRVQDYELWLRISEDYKIALHPEILCQIRYRDKSVAHLAGTHGQFKMKLLAYILHKRRVNRCPEISEKEWEDFFNKYEKWYYKEVAPYLTDVWTPTMKMFRSFKEKKILQPTYYFIQVIIQLLKRMFKPTKEEIILNIPYEFYRMQNDK